MLKNRSGHKLILFSIIFIGFVLRISGTGFGLDCHGRWHPNETVYLGTNIACGQFDPHWYSYPSLHMYILGLVDYLLYTFSQITGIFLGNISIPPAQYFQMHWALPYYTGRILSSIFGTFIIYIVYLVARKLMQNPASLFAAAFVGFHPLLVQESHYATVDMFLATNMLISLFYFMNILNNTNFRSYLIAGVFTGLSVSTKQPGILLIPVFLFAYFLSIKNKSFSLKRLSYPGLALLIAAAVFAVTSPYYIKNQITGSGLLKSHFSTIGGFPVEKGTPAFFKYKFFPVLFSYQRFLNFIMSSSGILFSSFAVSGVIISIFRPSREKLIFIFFLFIYFIVIGNFYVQTPRYIMPVLPVLAVFASIFLEFMMEWKIKAVSYSMIKYSMEFLAFLCIILLLCNSAILVREMVTEDTRVKAEKWLKKNLAPDSKILVEGPNDAGPSVDNLAVTGIYSPHYNQGTGEIPGINVIDVKSVDDCRKNSINYAVITTQKGSKEHEIFNRSLLVDPDSDILARFSHSRIFFNSRIWNFGFHNPDIEIYEIKYPANVHEKKRFFYVNQPVGVTKKGAFYFMLPQKFKGYNYPLWKKNVFIILYENGKPLFPLEFDLPFKNPEAFEPELQKGNYCQLGINIIFKPLMDIDPNSISAQKAYTYIVVDNFISNFSDMFMWMFENFTDDSQYIFGLFHYFQGGEHGENKPPGVEHVHPDVENLVQLTEFCKENRIDYLIFTELLYFSHNRVYLSFPVYDVEKGFAGNDDKILPGWRIVLKDKNVPCKFLIFKRQI